MEPGWTLIYSVDALYKAELIREKLEEEGILSDVLNKMDSLFKFGDIEVYVKKEDEPRAKEIINLIPF